MTDQKAPEMGDNNKFEITWDEIEKFFNKLENLRKGSKSASSKLSAEVTKINEKIGAHPMAMKLIRKLRDEMTIEQRNDFRRTFDVLYPMYCEEAWDAEGRDLLTPVEDNVTHLKDVKNGEESPEEIAQAMDEMEDDGSKAS